MKNLFKIKRPHRSNEIQPPPAAPSPSPSPSPSGAGSSCASSSAAAAEGMPLPTTPSPDLPPAASEAAAAAATAGAGEKQDYFSAEEEFQIQLALALSASNSDCIGDPDRDQIRAAQLLSLGRSRIDQDREEGTAESLSRRYWDYNVLDYHEKVIDGFYDIFGLPVEFSRQGMMPSLVDLQSSIGDLGFEVIVVNRYIDTTLVELEQIAQCILLDCPVAEIALLVQRIAELVTDNMGGRVMDANDILARWMAKSTELRTSLQTSLLPLGCITIGLSRHRSLLFKILADNVGIPCKLVKGSHYTGVDDNAVNIIKWDNGSEFLVDLMAAPGTLIPADVLSSKGTSLKSHARLNKNLATCGRNGSGDDAWRSEALCVDHNKQKNECKTCGNDNFNVDKRSRYENKITIPSAQNHSNGASSITGRSNYMEIEPILSREQTSQSSIATGTKSKQKDLGVVPENGEHMLSDNLGASADSIEPEDSRILFAELNPLPFKGFANRNSGYQWRRENIASGPGRPQQPLVLKNWSACNEVPNNKQYNFVEGMLPRRNIGDNVASSSSQVPCSFDKNYKANVAEGSDMPAAGHDNCNRKMTATSAMHSRVVEALEKDQNGDFGGGCIGKADGQLTSIQLLEDKSMGPNLAQQLALRSSKQNDPKRHAENFHGKHNPKKCPHDGLMGMKMKSKDTESSLSPSQARPSRLDPMLDDVSECEILWEDLVIGERIGLGSYGEVYRADWNGVEVAVKKFLDQDFYGDALDEFRSEVRIMRRLRHPNVVLFMGAVTRPPNLSIVSEFLPRGSLYRLIHRPVCQVDEKRRIKMALDVAKGMSGLHASVPTIVHRDLKSPNLLVDENWTVKVCDFGLSRLKHSTFLSSKSTAGTPEWMAPEVLRNEPSNEKCDVYSFGVILWELATLRMPWAGMNPMQVVGAVGFQDRRLDIPNQVDPLVATIIWECWQTDPSLRPSFAQLTTALKSLQRLVTPSYQEMQSLLVPQEISVNTTP